MTTITLAPHPTLDAVSFVTRFPRPLGALEPPASLAALLRPGALAPLASDDGVRKAVRELLRHGGYKPTGRGKPSSEYLLGAVAEGTLASINPAVDACNAVSYHSGLPISVVDLGRATEPFSIELAPPGASYAFNPTGQVIDLGGLLCLYDAAGPCANGVKDAQRTKTHSETVATLSVVWGTLALPGRALDTARWYRALLAELGAATEPVSMGR